MAPDPREARLRLLNHRFRAISRRYYRATEFRKFYRYAVIVGPIAVIVGFLLGWASLASPWPLMLTLKHLASYPNCDAARAVGLAPAREGEPGYWTHHDRDRDGIACEPWPK